jgi:hypothetical protein
MNYDEMLKTTQKKAQVINTKSDEQKKLKLANPDEKNKLKPQKAADKEFISKQTAAQNEFKKKYMSRRTGFDIIDGPEIEESSFVPVQESVELRAFDKTFKNRIKKDAKQWVSKWNDICQINDLNKNGYGFKIASKNVNYKTYSMMVGLNNWANAQKLKEQCASVLKGNKFYQKNKKIIDAFAPSPKMDIKAVKESENSSNNPLVLDLEYKKFTKSSVEAVRKYYEQFNNKDEKTQAELLKTAVEESLISMDYINDKALSPDAMPQRIMENKLLRDRLEAVHLYSATSGNTINEEFSEHIKLARQLFMALDADMRTCFVKNGMDFAENGSFLLEMNKQGVQIKSTYKTLSTAYHNLAKNHKEKGHCAELIIKSLAGYDTRKKNSESSDFLDIFNKELEEKIEAHGNSGDDELGIGQAVVNMQANNEEKYQANKAMLDPMIEDAKKVATSIDSLRHQIEYMEKITSGAGVPDDSSALSMRIQINENLKKSLNTSIEQKKRQVMELLGRANGFMNAMSNIYTDSELSPEGQDIIEKYRSNPDTYVDNSQTAQLLRKIGGLSVPTKFNNTSELKNTLISKLCAAKEASQKKELTEEEKAKISTWMNSTAGSLCLIDLDINGVDVSKLSDKELYEKIHEYAPLLGDLKKNKFKKLIKRTRKEEDVIKSIFDKVTEISVEFQKLFADNFGAMGTLKEETSTAKAFRDKIEKLIELRNKYDSVQKILYSEVDDIDYITKKPIKKTLIETLNYKLGPAQMENFEKIHAICQQEFKTAENVVFEFKLGELVKKLDMGVSIKKIVTDKVFGEHPDLYKAIDLFQNSNSNATEDDLIICVKTLYAKHKEYTDKTIKNLWKQFEKNEVVAQQKPIYNENIDFFVKKLREYAEDGYKEEDDAKIQQEVTLELVKEAAERRKNEFLDELKKQNIGNQLNNEKIDIDDEYAGTLDEELEKEVDYLLDIGNSNVKISLESKLSDIAKGNSLINNIDKRILCIDEKYLTDEEKVARENFMLLLNNIVEGAKRLNIEFMDENGKDAVEIPLLRKHARKLARIKNYKERESAKEGLKNKLLNGDKDFDGLSAGTKLRLLLMCDKNISGKKVEYVKKDKKFSGKANNYAGMEAKYQNFDNDQIKDILRNYEKLSFSPIVRWRDEKEAFEEQKNREAIEKYKNAVSVPDKLKETVDKLLGVGDKLEKLGVYENSILNSPKAIIESYMKRHDFDKRILYLDDDLLSDKERKDKNDYVNEISKITKAFEKVYGKDGTYADDKGDYDLAVIMDMAKKFAVASDDPEDSEEATRNLISEFDNLMSPSSEINDATRFRLQLLYYSKYGMGASGELDDNKHIYDTLMNNLKFMGKGEIDYTDYRYKDYNVRIRKNELKLAELKNKGTISADLQRKMDADAISNIVLTRNLDSIRGLFNDPGDQYLNDMGLVTRNFIEDFFKGMDKYQEDAVALDTSISDEEIKELKYIIDSTGYDSMYDLRKQMNILSQDIDSKFKSYSDGFRIRLAGIINSYIALANNSDELKESVARKKGRLENPGGYDESLGELFVDEDKDWEEHVKAVEKQEALEKEALEKEALRKLNALKNRTLDEVINDYMAPYLKELTEQFAERAKKEEQRNKDAILRAEVKKNVRNEELKNHGKLSKNEVKELEKKSKRAENLFNILNSRYKMRDGLKHILLADDLKDMFRAFDTKLLFIDPQYLEGHEKALISMFFKIKKRMISYNKSFENNEQLMPMSMIKGEETLLSTIIDSFSILGTENQNVNLSLKKNLLNEIEKKDGMFELCSDGFKLRLKMLLNSGFDAPSVKNEGFSSDGERNIAKYYEGLKELGFDDEELSILEQEKNTHMRNREKYTNERLDQIMDLKKFEEIDQKVDEVLKDKEEAIEKEIDKKLEELNLAEDEIQEYKNQFIAAIKEEVNNKVEKELKDGINEESAKKHGKYISKDEFDSEKYNEKDELEEEVEEELNNLNKRAKDDFDTASHRMTLDDVDTDVELAVDTVIKQKLSELGPQYDVIEEYVNKDMESSFISAKSEVSFEEQEGSDSDQLKEDSLNKSSVEQLKESRNVNEDFDYEDYEDYDDALGEEEFYKQYSDKVKNNEQEINEKSEEKISFKIIEEETKWQDTDEVFEKTLNDNKSEKLLKEEEKELQEQIAKEKEEEERKKEEERLRKEKEEEDRKKKEEERLRKEKEEEERLRKEKEEEELRLKKEKAEAERLRIAKEKYELAKKKYLESLNAQKDSRRKEIKKILESMLNNELDKMEVNMDDMTEEEMQKEIDKSTDEKFKYGIKKDNYNFGEIPSSMFKIFVTNEYGRFKFVKNEIDDKDEEIDRKVLLRFALHTLGKKALNHEYWQYVEMLPETDYRNIFYKKLFEALPENSYKLGDAQMLYFDKLFEHIDDYSSPRQLRDRMYELEKEFPQFYEEGKLKRGAFDYYYDLMDAWKKAESAALNSEPIQKQKYDKLYKELHNHKKMKIKLTEDVYKDKYQKKCYIQNGDTFEPQFYKNSCYATCSAYLLNKFFIQNPDLIDSGRLDKYRCKNSKFGKDIKDVYVNQEDFKYGKLKINDIAQEALDNKGPFDADTNSGIQYAYKNFLEESNSDNDSERDIYSISDKFINMSKNVCVNCIEFEPFSDFYTEALKKETEKDNLPYNNSVLDSSIDKYKVNGKKRKHFTPYMRDIKENYFQTVVGKIEELMEERPDTPIALLTADYGQAGHYVVVKGTTTDGRLIVMNPMHKKVNEGDTSELIPDMLMDVDKFFGYAGGKPGFTLTWLEKFDSKKAKEVEQKCDMKGASYNENGELVNSTAAEKSNLSDKASWLAHRNGVSFEVNKKLNGKNGDLFNHHIYVPKTYDPNVK